MILVGLISNDDLTHQKIKRLLLYNNKYSLGFACASFNVYNALADEKKNIDILIIDARSEEADAIYAIKNLNIQDNLKIIAITVDNQPVTILEMIKAGAVGFLIQPFSTDAFLLCLQNVTENKGFIDESILLKVFDIMHTEENEKRSLLLSEREFEIIKLITKGYKNKEIGERLHISHHTVNQHLKKIYRKFDVNSRGRLIHKLITINYAK